MATYKTEQCVFTETFHSSGMQKAPDKAAVDRIFSDLDSNQDNLVDFAEFGRMFICLTTMCHEFFNTKK